MDQPKNKAFIMSLTATRDEFRTSEITEGESEDLGDDFRTLQLELYGHDFDLEELMTNFKIEILSKNLRVPTKKGFLLKFIRAG